MKLHTIDTLMMPEYIKILEGADKALLVIEGPATEEEIENCWMDIFSESQALSSGAQGQAYLSLVGRINNAVATIEAVTNTVKSCLMLINEQELIYIPWLTSLKKDFGYDVRTDFKQNCIDDLTNIVNRRLNKVKDNLKGWQRQLEAMNGKQSLSIRASYQKNLTQIVKHLGVPLNMNALTVMSYFCYLNDLINTPSKAA